MCLYEDFHFHRLNWLRPVIKHYPTKLLRLINGSSVTSRVVTSGGSCDVVGHLSGGEAASNNAGKSGLLNDHCRLLHLGPDTVEELLDRHVVKTDKKHLDDDENEVLTRQRLTSTRREALSLYRDIIWATQFFMWPDSRGLLWRDVLRENARKEFEEACFEKDLEVVTRLIIEGRDAVQSPIDKLVEKQKLQIENERNELI